MKENNLLSQISRVHTYQFKFSNNGVYFTYSVLDLCLLFLTLKIFILKGTMSDIIRI